jgi:hypothetical protein
VVAADLEVAGTTWRVTCVSMGNPHAVTYGTRGGAGIKVRPLHMCLRAFIAAPKAVQQVSCQTGSIVLF